MINFIKKRYSDFLLVNYIELVQQGAIIIDVFDQNISKDTLKNRQICLSMNFQIILPS
jgi:hypothetical protein